MAHQFPPPQHRPVPMRRPRQPLFRCRSAPWRAERESHPTRQWRLAAVPPDRPSTFRLPTRRPRETTRPTIGSRTSRRRRKLARWEEAACPAARSPAVRWGRFLEARPAPPRACGRTRPTRRRRSLLRRPPLTRAARSSFFTFNRCPWSRPVRITYADSTARWGVGERDGWRIV